jgi:hypothetical protein
MSKPSLHPVIQTEKRNGADGIVADLLNTKDF